MVPSQGKVKRGKLHLVKGKGTELQSVVGRKGLFCWSLAPHKQSKAVLIALLLCVKCKSQLMFLHGLQDQVVPTGRYSACFALGGITLHRGGARQ